MLERFVDYVTYPIFYVKKYLVGELNWNDINDLRNYGRPLNKEIKPDDQVSINNFGLLGKMFSINNVYVLPKTTSTKDIETLLKDVDSLPNSRINYNQFNNLTDTPMFIATAGTRGTEIRKKFVKILPNPSKVLDKTITITTKILDENPALFINKNGLLDIYKVVRNILLEVMMDVTLTPEINELLEKMSQALLQPGSEDNYPQLKLDYHSFVSSVVNDLVHKEDGFGSSPLAKAMDECTKQVDMTATDAKEQLVKIITRDPVIHGLFTILVTSYNIGRLLVSTLYDSNLDTLNYIKNMGTEFENNITMEVINSSKSLSNLYKEALLMSDFEPAMLVRYLSEPISFAGVDIPAHTNLWIRHTNMMKSHDDFNPHAFDAQDAPKLGTAEFPPFSLGPRKCPGEKIAEIVYKGFMSVYSKATYLQKQITKLDPVNTNDENYGYSNFK